jgi:hypothetical protein
VVCSSTTYDTHQQTTQVEGLEVLVLPSRFWVPRSNVDGTDELTISTSTKKPATAQTLSVLGAASCGRYNRNRSGVARPYPIARCVTATSQSRTRDALIPLELHAVPRRFAHEAHRYAHAALRHAVEQQCDIIRSCCRRRIREMCRNVRPHGVSLLLLGLGWSCGDGACCRRRKVRNERFGSRAFPSSATSINGAPTGIPVCIPVQLKLLLKCDGCLIDFNRVIFCNFLYTIMEILKDWSVGWEEQL